MSLPQPVSLEYVPDYAPQPRPHQRAQTTRPRQTPKQLATKVHRALGWEMTLRLGINLSLSLVALAALVRLVPHYQAQRQALTEIESAVAIAAIKTDDLQADFGQYFDPVEASRLLQIQAGTQSGNSISVVLVNPQDGIAVPEVQE